MSPLIRTSSIPHPHKLRHKQPYSPSRHALSGTSSLSIVPLGLTLEQVKSLTWGMNVQIEEVMHKVKINWLHWNRVVLDLKELKLALDEAEFEREGGEIMWNTETGEDFPTDSEGEEEEERIEKVKVQGPMKVFVGSEKVDDSEDKAKGKTQKETDTDAQVQAIVNSPIEDFRKYLKLDHWTDDEVKNLQTWMVMPKEERRAARKALSAATAANSQAPASSSEAIDTHAAARSSKNDNSQAPHSLSHAANSEFLATWSSTTNGLQAVKENEDARRFAEMEYRKKRLAQRYNAERDTVLGTLLGATPSQCLGADQDSVTSHYVDFTKDIGTSKGATASQRVVPSLGGIASQGGVVQPAVASSINPHQGAGSYAGLDPFDGVLPPRRGLFPSQYPSKPNKTDEEVAAEIDQDVECFKRAMGSRKVQLAQDAEAQLSKGLPIVAHEEWKKEEARLEVEINLRAEQYRAMLIAARKWEKGETTLPGLGQEAQKKLNFMDCDEAEQMRRAGEARKIREEYYIKASTNPHNRHILDSQGFTAAEMHAFMFSPEDNADFKAYEAELAAEFEAGIAAGMGQSVAAKKAVKVVGAKKQVPINDDVEAQIRRRMEAREKQEAERARVTGERALAKETERAGGGKGKKSQKRGKSGGRKHKK